MKIAVIGGAGAMGSVVGGKLAQSGNDVTLIDVSRGAVDAINDVGLRIEGKTGDTQTIRVRATTAPATVGEVELAIVFTKNYHTEAAIRGIATVANWCGVGKSTRTRRFGARLEYTFATRNRVNQRRYGH